MTQYEKLNFVNGSPPALNAATLNHIEDGIVAATEGVTAVEKTVKDNKTKVDTALTTKTDKATTLEGYGITDGENTKNKISDKSKITDENANYPSIKYLDEYYYDFEETDNLLSQKYDSSNIETGIGSLTPSSNSKDVIQSADFKYQRIGNKVTIGISITFIAGEYREIELIKLPFVCQNEDLRGICVTNTNREFIWKIYDSWLTSSSYLRISRTDSYNFSNNENLNFTFSYFIDT